MTRHAKKSDPLQPVDLPKTMAVEIPLPLLEVFGSIENSFFELCIDSGQQVLRSMMEQDREDLCGPRWKRDPELRAGRAGTTKSELTLGGRRISIPRLRVRSKEGVEMELPSFAFAASRDPLDRHTLHESPRDCRRLWSALTLTEGENCISLPSARSKTVESPMFSPMPG